MRVHTFQYLLSVCLLIVLVRAWSPVDHEIFRLKDEVEAGEGKDVTFYEFIGVKPSATWEDISKAFKKKSRSIHPDKARQQFVATKSTRPPKKDGEKRKPGVHVSKGPSQREIDAYMKEATARYSRLGVVVNVLKGTQRERYDHFLNHGFPAWRGTGYYYTRYRPGLGTVITGLFLFGGGAAHFYTMKISYNGHKRFMEKYIKDARKSAWGNESGIPGISTLASSGVDVPAPEPEEPDPSANLNRAQKRYMEKQNKKDKSKPAPKTQSRVAASSMPVMTETVQPQGQKRRVTAQNGKQLLVDSIGNVFLCEEVEDEETGEVTKQEHLLDPDDIPEPTIYDTAVVRLPVWLFRKAFDPFMKSTKPIADDTVPHTEDEVQAQVAELSATKDTTPDVSVPPSMSASQDFEMLDASMIRNEMGANGGKKRNKKNKK